MDHVYVHTSILLLTNDHSTSEERQGTGLRKRMTVYSCHGKLLLHNEYKADRKNINS